MTPRVGRLPANAGVQLQRGRGQPTPSARFSLRVASVTLVPPVFADRRAHRVARATLASAVLCVLSALASCAPTKVRPDPPVRSTPAPAPARPAPAPRATEAPRSQVKIRGLHGTLNDSDVHLTMDGRQQEFSRCIALSRRSLRWVSGAVRFSFRVDADGRITDLRRVESTIGHRVLEQCITSVVAETQFRKPSGGATARFDWQMTVEPVNGRPAEELDPDKLKPVLRKRTRELVESCGLDRAHERYRVTAYLDRRGRVLSAGAVAMPADAEDKVDCVLQAFRRWRLPRYARHGKLSFELR